MGSNSGEHSSASPRCAVTIDPTADVLARAGQAWCAVVDAAGVSARFVTGYQNWVVPPAGTLVAVGNFDGVHVGHRALIEHVLAQAKARSLTPVAVTFDPHPAEVLSASAPLLLTSTTRKSN